MIDAFKSTLEELKFASLVLLVMDASDSLDVFERKFVASRDVISEFEVPETKIIYVLNKADITSENEAFDKADKLGLSDRNRLILVSAKTCFNINNLRNMIRESIFANTALLPKKCG
jgi:GTP-binding protein HflX